MKRLYFFMEQTLSSFIMNVFQQFTNGMIPSWKHFVVGCAISFALCTPSTCHYESRFNRVPLLRLQIYHCDTIPVLENGQHDFSSWWCYLISYGLGDEVLYPWLIVFSVSSTNIFTLCFIVSCQSPAYVEMQLRHSMCQLTQHPLC
jgi:hypothetical protein